MISVDVRKRSKNVYGSSIKNINLKKSNFHRPPNSNFITIILDADEIKQVLGGKVSGRNLLKKRKIDYPKYWYGHISLANQHMSATKACKVGKVHSLIQQRKFRNVNEWKRWHTKKYPNAVNDAVELVYTNLKEGVGISRRGLKKYVRKFVEHLLFDKTFTGLKIQEAILIKLAEIYQGRYIWATSKEDSAGIDGYIDGIPVSIKPISCNEKKAAGTKRVNYTINEKDLTLSFTISG